MDVVATCARPRCEPLSIVIPGERHYRDGDRVRHARWGDGMGQMVPWQGAGFGLGAPNTPPIPERYAGLPPSFGRQGALFDRYFTQTGALPPPDQGGRTAAERMLRQMGPDRTPPPPPSLAVPGGASIRAGKPMAAAPPPPFIPPDQGATGTSAPTFRRRTR